MRLTIRAFGLDLLDVELSTDSAPYEVAEELGEYDPASVLSGGSLGAYPVDTGSTDLHMGFTSGLEYGDE